MISVATQCERARVIERARLRRIIADEITRLLGKGRVPKRTIDALMRVRKNITPRKKR
jgi:hypothetical protein